MTKENPNQHPPANETQCSSGASSGLERVREAARRDRHQQFTSLMHHVTKSLLHDSFRRLKKDAASGVDNVTWVQYAQVNLGERIADLHDRLHNGRYRAKPSKRIYIPKSDGRQRPIGIAALEDKIVQKAVANVLGQIYEEDFVGLSYGYRAGRKQHDALDALHEGIMGRKINWILDADIRGFFDSIDHGTMVKFLEHRIGDKRVIRLISKWLRAGVSENGQWSKTSVGTPQGAVISSLLANIYLHYVLDLWYQHWTKHEAKGQSIMVRYADDFVIGFQYRWEAEQFLRQLKQRLTSFGLELHPDKTRLIEFGRFARSNRDDRGEGPPPSFDFLGFTHTCGRTRKSGKFTVKRLPIARRLRSKVQYIKDELRKRRHEPIPQQGKWLKATLQGLLNYYAVPGTAPFLNSLWGVIGRAWIKSLRKRSQKGDRLTYARMRSRFDRWIPKVRIIHPYPNQRLRV